MHFLPNVHDGDNGSTTREDTGDTDISSFIIDWIHKNEFYFSILFLSAVMFIKRYYKKVINILRNLFTKLFNNEYRRLLKGKLFSKLNQLLKNSITRLTFKF